MSGDRLQAILDWLDSAELQHENSEGEKSFLVILPEILLTTLVSHLQRLRRLADLESSIASKLARAGLPPEGYEGEGVAAHPVGAVNAAIQGTPAAMREAVTRARDGEYPKMTHEEIRARAEASRMNDSRVSRRLAHACLQLLDEGEGLRHALDHIEWESEDHEECQGAAADALEEAGLHVDRHADRPKPSPTSPAPDKSPGWVKCPVCGVRANLDIAVICERCGRAVHKLCTGDDGTTCMRCARRVEDHG